MTESKVQKISYTTFVAKEELRGKITQCLQGSPSSASVTSALPYALGYFANEVIATMVVLGEKILITGLPSSSGKDKTVNLTPKILLDALEACQASNEAATLRDKILAQPVEVPNEKIDVEFSAEVMTWLKSESEALAKEKTS